MSTSRRNQVRTTALYVVFAAFAAGCKRDEVQTYQAPKDNPAPAAPAPTVAETEPTTSSNVERAPGTPWKVPAGWQTKPSDGIRIASYGVTATDGRAVDISVVAMSGESGGELANVNRWRGQAALDPITEADLPGSRKTVPIGNRTGVLYEFKGEKPTIEGKYKPGMLVGQLPAGELTVFFKMVGEAELVSAEKPHFLEWLKSVQTEASDSGPSAGGTAAASPSASAPTDMRGPVAPPPSTDLPTWAPPSHWKSSGPRPMRLASFEVPNAGGGAPGDLSISALSGSAGGLTANVNRWRGQVGLEPLDDEALAKESQKIELSSGGTATLVDLHGTSKRILAIVAPRGDKTWFYKLTGDDALVTKEREGFIQFVKTVKY